jgi:hypothetical protein
MDIRTELEENSISKDWNEDLKCWHLAVSPHCLRIKLLDGTEFLLPYGYFEGAVLRQGQESDLLKIQFKSFHFAIEGKDLNGLVNAFQQLSVEFLHAIPSRYKILAKSGFVSEIKLISPEKLES